VSDHNASHTVKSTRANTNSCFSISAAGPCSISQSRSAHNARLSMLAARALLDLRADFVGDAKRAQRLHGVGSEQQHESDFAQGRCTLDHRHTQSSALERQSCGEPTHACTDDQRVRRSCLCHGRGLRHVFACR
jgi:hypothetical protein